MTFTYDPTLATDRDWVRFQVTDTVVNNGPRIEGRNYSDEEIAALLAAAHDDKDVVVAQIFQVLYTEWIQMAISYTIGPRKEELYRISEAYKLKAEQWASLAGLGFRAFSSGVFRAGSHDNSEHT